jgi:hypothetical protein
MEVSNVSSTKHSGGFRKRGAFLAGLEMVYDNYTSYMLQDGSEVNIYNGCELDCLKRLSKEYYYNIIRRSVHLSLEYRNTAGFESMHPKANSERVRGIDCSPRNVFTGKFIGVFYWEPLCSIEAVFESPTGVYMRFTEEHITYKANKYKAGAWYQIQRVGSYWYCDNDFMRLFNVRLIK